MAGAMAVRATAADRPGDAMDIEQQIKLAAEFEAKLAEKDAHIKALTHALGKLSFEVKCLKGMLRDRVPMDIEAE
jgi:hypothetical protein